MSKIGTANTVKYVKRPSQGGKDVRPGKFSAHTSPRNPTKSEKKGQ